MSCAVAPVCGRAGAAVYRAALGRTVRLDCTVLANPTDVSFHWTFTNMAMQVKIIKGMLFTQHRLYTHRMGLNLFNQFTSILYTKDVLRQPYI